VAANGYSRGLCARQHGVWLVNERHLLQEAPQIGCGCEKGGIQGPQGAGAEPGLRPDQGLVTTVCLGHLSRTR
jgi:hypothetical protein